MNLLGVGQSNLILFHAGRVRLKGLADAALPAVLLRSPNRWYKSAATNCGSLMVVPPSVAGRFVSSAAPSIADACVSQLAQPQRKLLPRVLCDQHSGEIPENAWWRLHVGDSQDDPPSEYVLSLGHITDMLRDDYPRLFEQSPDFWNWNIYDDNISLELQPPIHMPVIRGKRAYRRTLTAIRSLAKRYIRNGTVARHMQDGQSHGHALRVKWKVEGDLDWLGVQRRVCMSAFSSYSLREQSKASRAADVAAGNPDLAYRIHRHAIELIEIEPPLLFLRPWKEHLEKEWQACGA